MKALAFFSCLLAGSAACAAVTSDATFGVLKVASTNVETVISVPWVSATNLNTSVAVKDFVKTTGMTDGDELYLYDNNNGTYKLWVFDASENKWKGTLKVSAKITSITGESAGSDTNLIARGSALIIARQKPTTSDIYLYGQYKSDGGTTYEMASSTDAVKSTLFAPINTTTDGIYLNGGEHVATGKYYLTWDNVVDGDTLTLQGANGQAVTLVWHENKWGFYNRFSNPKGWVYTMQIQPGMGAWYRAVADADRDGNPVARRNTKE